MSGAFERSRASPRSLGAPLDASSLGAFGSIATRVARAVGAPDFQPECRTSSTPTGSICLKAELSKFDGIPAGSAVRSPMERLIGRAILGGEGGDMRAFVNSSDNLTPEQRKHTMAQVHSVDSKPEMQVRRLVHGMGYRYRLHRKDLPGNPDLVFPARHKIIFVHGCFWHGHECRAGKKRPRTNEEYWMSKLERNRVRDASNQAILRQSGWDILVLWECELREREALADRILSFLGPKGQVLNA